MNDPNCFVDSIVLWVLKNVTFTKHYQNEINNIKRGWFEKYPTDVNLV